MRLDPHTMNEVCKILYNKDGADAVYDLANELADVHNRQIGWSKCDQCDADTPHVITVLTQCMVCSQYKVDFRKHSKEDT